MFKQSVADIQKFLRLGNPPVWALCTVPASLLISALLGVIPPLLIGGVVDALHRRDIAGTVHDLLLYMGATVAIVAVGLVNSLSGTVLRETFARNVQLRLIEKIGRAQFKDLFELTPGQLTNRLIGDVRSLTSQLEYSVFPNLYNVCSLIAALVIMMRLNYRLTLVALVGSFIILLPLRLAKARIKAIQERSSVLSDEAYGFIVETMAPSPLKAFRNNFAFGRRFTQIHSISKSIYDTRISGVAVGALVAVGSAISNMLGPSVVLAYGVYLVVHNQLTVGTMIAVLIYQSRLTGPVTGLSQLQVAFTNLGVTMRRLLEIASLPDEEGGSLTFELGPIAFKAVGMERKSRWILSDIDLRVETGAHVAIVGPSGAGKSSLATLIARFYEPDAGIIEVGSHRLADFTLSSLRRAVCLVQQDSFLFDGTVLENVSLYCESFEKPLLDEALFTSKLDDVIGRLPDGLLTRVGPHGFQLSGGERQKVCLARAILQSPEILVLDEALSAVDVETERAIIADLRRMYSSRTIIAITHRLESVQTFDSVFVLDSGALVAQGRAEDLFSSERWQRNLARWNFTVPKENYPGG